MLVGVRDLCDGPLLLHGGRLGSCRIFGSVAEALLLFRAGGGAGGGGGGLNERSEFQASWFGFGLPFRFGNVGIYDTDSLH